MAAPTRTLQGCPDWAARIPLKDQPSVNPWTHLRGDPRPRSAGRYRCRP